MRIFRPAAFFFASLLLAACAVPSVPVSAETPPLLLISEVQTGGTENASQEFVELYNQTDEVIELTGWQLQYQSATGTSWTTKAALAGELAPGNILVIGTTAYGAEDNIMSAGVAGVGGRLRVADPSGSIVTDLVSWGTATYGENDAAPAPDAGKSIQRCFAGDLLADTGDDAADFKQYDQTTPGLGIACADSISNPDNPENPVEYSTPCAGIVINEILPNPRGTDAEAEFIELYNPSETDIPLGGCALRINDNTYSFKDDDSAPAQSYFMVSSGTMSFTLPNASGGTVHLLDINSSEIDGTSYPPDTPEGATWAIIGDTWQITYAPTPGAANQSQPSRPCPEGQERSLQTGRCQAATSMDSTLQPCATGYSRNPITNRCRKVVAANTTLKPCAAGQIRNPLTNRCKTATARTTALAPCKPGQQRNPATNRCRSTAVAGSTLKPCPAGQTRNVQTNRCRKTASTAKPHAVDVQDVAAQAHNPVSWWVASMLGLAALAYAVYEWRQELIRMLQKIKQRGKRKNPTP